MYYTVSMTITYFKTYKGLTTYKMEVQRMQHVALELMKELQKQFLSFSYITVIRILLTKAAERCIYQKWQVSVSHLL